MKKNTDSVGIHETHCCKVHGYGDIGCPVYYGTNTGSVCDECEAEVTDPKMIYISKLEEELRQLNDGERIVVPKSKEHANAMILVSEFYLKITSSVNDLKRQDV